MQFPPSTPSLADDCRRIADSFQCLLGRPLVETTEDMVQALWEASRVIVAHRAGPDPVFFYGNRLALDLFEMDWAAFTQLPSRLSAEPLLRDERARLLARVARDGYIDDYAGVRISRFGRRFRIEQAIVWNLLDDAGHPCGQAATFDRWQML
jgi:hypothetical protein